jgi:hypothetical protein
MNGSSQLARTQPGLLPCVKHLQYQPRCRQTIPNDDLVIASAADACCFSTLRAAGFSECPAFDWRFPLVAARAAPPNRSVTCAPHGVRR